MSFLYNKNNKQGLIDLIAKHLMKKGVDVEHAGDEGDADVVIVKKALELADSYEKIVVVADDTDIFVLLAHHAPLSSDIYMKRQNDTLSIKVTKHALGSEMCKCILFAHAMSGCDTTSSFFRQGKVKLFNMCLNSEELRNKVLVFGDKESTKEIIHEVGEEIIA